VRNIAYVHIQIFVLGALMVIECKVGTVKLFNISINNSDRDVSFVFYFESLPTFAIAIINA